MITEEEKRILIGTIEETPEDIFNEEDSGDVYQEREVEFDFKSGYILVNVVAEIIVYDMGRSGSYLYPPEPPSFDTFVEEVEILEGEELIDKNTLNAINKLEDE